ncbi:hypothetical protein LTR10_012578 [Elasticomyces elasticus]|uniref:Uncharacterized protein n=1 Tax=Exophiala sideris TaxID=1016849 RepID=A0ABR0JRK6_9EURO|nr:hypothetical protein LTR10_012578 [Elasticomyces elasticus]KAK5040222.1 hypothetical protein LTS07_000719 [Exophiala sideris]KAK5043353.1 hypothetical protein LTR13_001124 [Exophiala sideris]KAK5068600.1 hypothetical protein LTR69_000720 [Exophiala sideris]KAK5186198.1 hypothetical protein LTR44_001253 [Eurotiomycetes sp. CCFEE 6388]
MPATKKTGPKSGTNVKWSPEAEVFLLEWLDKNKGSEGALLQNADTALDGLTADEDFQKCLPGIKALSADERRVKVTARLQWFWRNYRLSPKYDEAPYTVTTIYTKGVEVLDWEKLGSRYVDLYTSEQLQARKALPPTSTSAGQTTRKRSAPDDLDQDDNAENRPSPKRLRSWTINARNEVPNTLDTSAEEPESREQRRARQNEMLSDLDFGKLPKFRLLLMDEHSHPLLKTDVDFEMKGIYNQMRRAVEEYVRSYDLHESSPVILEPMLAYPPRLNSLLSETLGGVAEDVDSRRMLFQKVQQEVAIGYGYFIRSLLAAAITIWCFRTNINEKEIYRSYGAGVIQAAFEKVLDPSVEMRLRETLLEVHVERNLKPRIRTQAEMMAFRFQAFVDLLLPKVEEAAPNPETSEVVSCPWTDPDHPDTTNFPDEYFHEGEARVNFRIDLVSIFERSLKWRAERNKSMHEKYMFNFPALGKPYITKQMWEERDSEGNKRHGGVILCLLPVTFRSVRQDILGKWEPWQKVGDGIVL